MLKILALTLLLCCLISASQDAQIDIQDKSNMEGYESFYRETYLPIQNWQMQALYNFKTHSRKLRVAFWNNTVYSSIMQNRYMAMGMIRNWYRLKCQFWKENGQQAARVSVHDHGVQEQKQYFLTNSRGQTLIAKSHYDNLPQTVQKFYLSKATCWANYRAHQIPYYLIVKSLTTRAALVQGIRLCKQNFIDFAEWELDDVFCVPISVVGDNPGKYEDMYKGGNKDAYVKPPK